MRRGATVYQMVEACGGYGAGTPIIVDVDGRVRRLAVAALLPVGLQVLELEGVGVGADAADLAGDDRASYGQVYAILPALQQAGVAKVGLMSQPVQQPKR